MANRINAELGLPILGKTSQAAPSEQPDVQELKAELEKVKQMGNQIIDEATHEITMRNNCLRDGIEIIKKVWPLIHAKGCDSGDKDQMLCQEISLRIESYLDGPKGPNE